MARILYNELLKKYGPENIDEILQRRMIRSRQLRGLPPIAVKKTRPNTGGIHKNITPTYMQLRIHYFFKSKDKKNK